MNLLLILLVLAYTEGFVAAVLILTIRRTFSLKVVDEMSRDEIFRHLKQRSFVGLTNNNVSGPRGSWHRLFKVLIEVSFVGPSLALFAAIAWSVWSIWLAIPLPAVDGAVRVFVALSVFTSASVGLVLLMSHRHYEKRLRCRLEQLERVSD